MCFLNIKAFQHILLHQIHKIMIFKKASYDLFKCFKICFLHSNPHNKKKKKKITKDNFKI